MSKKIIIITTAFLFTVVTLLTPLVQGQSFFYLNPKFNLVCLLFPSVKKSITNPNLPNLKLRIPCSWTSSWSSASLVEDDQTDYTLTIKQNGINRLVFYFPYLAIGCNSDENCFQTPTVGSTTIGPKFLRSPAQDPNLGYFFPVVSHDVHYHNYINIDSTNKIPFPFGIGFTNHNNGTGRVVFAIGQKTNPAALGLLEMDEIINSIKF
ncbi:MAG: hypothetical protein ACRCXZ_00260 [Patescibacteria group bacterium]